MIDGFDVALGQIATPQSAGLILIGLAVGTAAAILPGVSGVTMMALLLPITFTMDKYDAFIFLVALMASGGFAGSITSILINVPGDGINAATCLDGYPLARQGKAGVAIGASATASGLGMLFGTGVLILSLPIIASVILSFGPAEFFALSILGTTLIATVSTRSPIKGLVAGMLGMLLGFVGTNEVVGGTRYTFGVPELIDGVPFVPALIGLFAFPELFDLMRTNTTISRIGVTVRGGVREGIREVLRRPALLIQSSLLGALMGLMPGVGQTIAAWVSYYTAMNRSKDPESFGKGNIEGVIAPEATTQVKEAASMLPVLVFGLPSGVSGAILLLAFQTHGVVPGTPLLIGDGALVWIVILTIFIVSQSTSLLGLVFANSMVRITLVPVAVLVPIIYVIALIGSYGEGNSLFGVVMAVVFGLAGVGMSRFDYPRAPLIVGLILVPLAEKYFFQAQQLSRGSFEFMLRPITLAVLLLTVGFVAFPFVRRWWLRRRSEQSGLARAIRETTEQQRTVRNDVSPGELMFTLLLAAFVALFVVQTIALDARIRAFPVAFLVPLSVLVAILVWRSVRSSLGRGPFTLHVVSRREWVVTAWLLSLPALMFVFGLLAASIVYILAFICLFVPSEFSLRRVIVAVATTTAIVALEFFVFEQALGVPLHRGIFG